MLVQYVQTHFPFFYEHVRDNAKPEPDATAQEEARLRDVLTKSTHTETLAKLMFGIVNRIESGTLEQLLASRFGELEYRALALMCYPGVTMRDVVSENEGLAFVGFGSRSPHMVNLVIQGQYVKKTQVKVLASDEVQSIGSKTRFKVIRPTRKDVSDKRFEFQGIACTSMQTSDLSEIATYYNVSPSTAKANVCSAIREAALNTEFAYRLALTNKK